VISEQLRPLRPSGISKMPSYKLTYFDVRGRAESIRMLFAMAGAEYENCVVGQADWPEMKKKVPLGALPILEVDGKLLLQSRGIASYLAREFGFYGANSWETAKVDEVNGLVEDLWLPLVEIMYSSMDKEKKEEQTKAYYEEKFPKFMGFLEETLAKNNNGEGFFVGDKISLADLNYHTSIETIEATPFPNKGLEKYPKLAALKDRISAHEKLAPYLAARKKTDI